MPNHPGQAEENLLPLAETSFNSSKFSKIVLGGTAASHTCSGVGGGHFFDQEVGSQMRLGLGVWGEEPPLVVFRF